MHTATNYYLFSLAVSDLLLLMSGLPSEMYYIWSNYPYIFGEAFCVVQSFAAETSANATVLTITAFTVERYVAICHPFLSHTMSKLSRAVKYIIAIWCLALCLAIPQAIQFGIVYQKSSNGTFIDSSAMCSVKPTSIQHAFEISSVLFFVVPMLIIVVLYMLIGLKLKNTRLLSISNRNPIPNYDYSDNIRAKSCAQRNVIRMLVAVVVAFFICWAPFHAQRLLAVYAQRNKKDERKRTIVLPFYTALTYISGVLYYLSTTINPLLYNIMSNKFREAFKVSENLDMCFLTQSGSGLISIFVHEKVITIRSQEEEEKNMVRLHVKRQTESLFLYDTSVEAKVDEIIQEVTAIHNGRLKVSRLCYDLEDLAEHGTMLPPNMQGLTDDQIEELHLTDEWGEKCIPSGGWTFNRDVMGRRNGKQPQENMQAVVKKAIEDARALISKKLIEQDKLVTMRVVQEALDVLRGATMIVYPMGLPPHDVIRLELENNEDLSGTHASLEVIDFQMAQLWFSGKELLRGCKLKEFAGSNEKTKIVVKLSKRGSGAPPREPVLTDDDRKQLMLQAHRRQEELKDEQDNAKYV
ncbi:G-protein coupled receptor 39 [Copidosoma floridanum]|uniref:G-protein coupled receptor 39 n=1 Tax=Copidosoma floridanum TaxID=29053 RepID=UPI000C6F79E6|nr:G-protein coupled receptor 39 [Copidosoma floridanum]